MYGFPKDLDLTALIGAEVMQMRLGPCDVQLIFDSTHVFSVEGRIEVLEGEVLVAYWSAESGWSDLSFQKLLSSEVEGYKLVNNYLLEVSFIGGLVLRFHDDSDQYERLQIHPEVLRDSDIGGL